jgi:hypothetical protein
VVGELRLRRRGTGMLRRFLDVFGEVMQVYRESTNEQTCI